MLDVKRTVIPQVDGSTGMVIGVDLSLAPVPDRRYVCDAVTVIIGQDGLCRFVFGQSRLTGKGFRSLVVVQLSSWAVAMFLKSMVEVGPNIRSIVQASGRPKFRFCEVQEEPQQTVELAANIIGAAHVNNEACLDFYHVSAFAAHYVRSMGNKMPVDPVVRVILPAAALVAVWEYLTENTSRFPEIKETEE